MTPQERTEFNEMKKTIASLVGVTNVPFIESLKLRGGDAIKGDSLTVATSITKSVDEAGVSTYSVANVPDFKLEILLGDGTTKFIGVHNA